MRTRGDENDYLYSTSKMQPFHNKIKNLLKKGCSIRSAWKIINYEMKDEVSYTAFYLYIKRYIKNL